MSKCKHKRQEQRNCYYENYYCVEYDVYCRDCEKYLGHWAYGHSDVEENLYFEKWYNRLFYSVKTKIKSFFRKNNYDDSDLPF